MAELELETQQVVEESILYVLTVVSLLMDMSVKIVNTQKKDEDKTYT